MSNIIERIIIHRKEAPFRVEVGFYTPADGLDLVDIQYLEFDDRRLEPVGNDIAINILDLSTKLNEFMTDMVPRMRAVKPHPQTKE